MSGNDQTTGRESFFSRLKKRLAGSRGLGLEGRQWFAGRQLDDELAEELETRLLMSDAGVEATEKILQHLRRHLGSGEAPPGEIQRVLQEGILEILGSRGMPLDVGGGPRPFVILMVGVNGSGKTTTIGKLAARFKEQGLTVMLAAGDTYRAAAVEQLKAWGENNQVPVIAQDPGADPAAVIYDAMEAARARGVDVLLADTAGRLQNQEGLMRELEKIVRVMSRLDPSAPHETMLVLDSSLGQNALTQAEAFHAAVGLTGITMTKLDGGGKGGILLAIAERLDIPFRFIGIGEGAADLDEFNPQDFTSALIGEESSKQ